MYTTRANKSKKNVQFIWHDYLAKNPSLAGYDAAPPVAAPPPVAVAVVAVPVMVVPVMAVSVLRRSDVPGGQPVQGVLVQREVQGHHELLEPEAGAGEHCEQRSHVRLPGTASCDHGATRGVPGRD